MHSKVIFDVQVNESDVYLLVRLQTWCSEVWGCLHHVTNIFPVPKWRGGGGGGGRGG